MPLHVLLALGPLALQQPTATAHRQDAPRAEQPAAQPAQPRSPADQPLAEHRAALLELGFKAASAMPLVPHVKNRSRAQAEVVEACIALDQPARALAFVHRIENWRRGMGFADLALWCAERGDAELADRYIALARTVSEAPLSSEDDQEWRADRIRAGIARALLLLGRGEEAGRVEAALAPSELGQVQALRASLHEQDVAQELAGMRAAFATGNFDLVSGAMQRGLALFERHVADAELRPRIEAATREAWPTVPIQLRIDALSRFARAVLGAGETEAARGYVDEVQGIADDNPWIAQDEVPLRAGLARLRAEAGQPEVAREQATRARDLFAAERERIYDIYRADALLPLAEAWHALGDREAALATYRLALEEGLVNPNSRPRADDLVALCCSMAVNGVEPDEELVAALKDGCASLGAPW